MMDEETSKELLDIACVLQGLENKVLNLRYDAQMMKKRSAWLEKTLLKAKAYIIEHGLWDSFEKRLHEDETN